MNYLAESNCHPKKTDFAASSCVECAPSRTDPRRPFRIAFWRGLSIALALWMSCAVLTAAPAAAIENAPDGTIELSGKSVAAGVGYSWANGTLTFQGKKYHLKVDGISVIHVGVSDYTASGTVYNLTKLSDINGVYTAVSAGAAVGGGASVTTMKNSNGVVIQMVSTHEGLNLSLGPKGVTVELDNA